MKFCISQATTMPNSFADDVEEFVEGGCRAMEVWLTKLESHLESHPAESARALLHEKGIELAAASFQGGLLLSQGEERKLHFDHFRKRLELCQFFGIPTLVVVGDFHDPLDGQAFERARVSLKQAAQWAAGFDVRLGLEFRAKSSFCASLDTALQFVAACDEENLGVVLDTFEYATGPSKESDLALLTNENVALVQVSDVVGLPRELATDADRILPGEGDLPIAPVFERLRQLEYPGWVSLELFNPTLWQVKASQVVELGLGALRRALESGS